MSLLSIPTTFQFRRGTTDEWVAADPVLMPGEPGIDTDLDRLKIGDGVTAWSALPFVDAWIQAALVAGLAGKADTAYFSRRAGAGAHTLGDVVKVGAHAHVNRDDIGTGYVAGGAPNYENVVGGNVANVDTPTSNLVNPTPLTNENGNWVFVLGGYDVVVNGWAVIAAGFHVKVGLGANHATVSGGSKQTVDDGVAYPTIGGGTNNRAAAGATSGTVGGGNGNTVSGNSTTVAGGLNNTAGPGTGATVPGGRDNTAAGDYSIATGRQAKATEYHQEAHAGGAFATAGDAQLNRWPMKKQTTDAAAANLEITTGTPPVIPELTTWAFTALVVARRVGTSESAAFEVKGCLKRDAGNTAAFVGAPTVTSLGASAGAATWTVTTGSFSVGTLRLIVTGEAGKTIRWVAELRATQVGG